MSSERFDSVRYEPPRPPRRRAGSPESRCSRLATDSELGAGWRLGPISMPSKAGNKKKDKEVNQIEESARERKRQQKINSAENFTQEPAEENNEDSKQNEANSKTNERAEVLYKLLCADFNFDPTTPTSVESAMKDLEKEKAELTSTGSEIEQLWSNFKNLNIFTQYTTLQAEDPTISPAVAILDLWNSMRRRQESGTEIISLQTQKRGNKHTFAGSDPQGLALAAQISEWMDESTRIKLDAGAEYDRCRSLYESICQLLSQSTKRCARIRKHLGDLLSLLKNIPSEQSSTIGANSISWSDFACSFETETALPPSTNAFRFANPAILIQQTKHGCAANLCSPSVELLGRIWVAVLCAGEIPGFLGLYIDAGGGDGSTVPSRAGEDARDRFFIRASVRRGTIEQVCFAISHPRSKSFPLVMKSAYEFLAESARAAVCSSVYFCTHPCTCTQKNKSAECSQQVSNR